MSNNLANKDIQILNNLRNVVDTLIQDCIRLTNWENPGEVVKHKEIIKKRIIRYLEEFLSQNSSTDSEYNLGLNIEDSSPVKVFDSGEQHHEIQESQSQSAYSSNYPYQNQTQIDPQKDCGLFNELETPLSPSQIQSTLDHSQLRTMYNHPINVKRKHHELDEQSAAEDNLVIQSEKTEIDYSEVHSHHRSFKHIPNPPSNYQCSNARREIFPDIGYSRSISSYPVSEKKRVIDFFNAHYDPAKRNKIEVIQQIVQSLHYSYASVYFLVSNQNPYQDQYALNPTNINVTVSSYPTQSQAQSLNRSVSSTRLKPRYHNKGCYSKPGRPKKILQKVLELTEQFKCSQQFPNTEESFHQTETPLTVNSEPILKGRLSRDKLNQENKHVQNDNSDGNSQNQVGENIQLVFFDKQSN